MATKRTIIAGSVLALIAVGGAITGVAVASGSGDSDTPITGSAYDRATEKALEVTGGGTVTETEQGDEESYYQVEVRKADGSQVDVNLDRDFIVVKTKTELETPGDEDSDSDD